MSEGTVSYVAAYTYYGSIVVHVIIIDQQNQSGPLYEIQLCIAALVLAL